MGADFCIRLAGSALTGGAGVLLIYLLIPILGKERYIKWEKHVWIWQALCMLMSLSGFCLFKGCPIVVADYILVGRNGEQSLGWCLTVCWFTVSAVLILYYFISYQKQYRKVIRWSRENCEEAISQIILETADALQMKKLPQIRVMENTDRSPFVMGVIKELLVLPEEELSEKDMHYILRHEMIHLKKKDIWLELFFTGMCCIYWFHPLVWMMRKWFRQSVELSCDAVVVENISYEEKKEYCDILMWYAGYKSKSTHIGILEYAGESRFLKRRFSVILEEKQSGNKKNAGCIAVMGIVLLLLNIGFNFQPGEKQYLYTKKNIEYGIEVHADINGDTGKERVWVTDNVRGDNAFTQISVQYENGEIKFKDYPDYWSSYLVTGDLTGNGTADVVLMRLATGSTYGGGEFSVLHMGENGWEEYTDNFIPNEKIKDIQPVSFKSISCVGASIVEDKGKCLLRVIAMEDYMEDTVKCMDCSYTEAGWFIEQIELITDYFETDKEEELLGIK